MDNKIMELVSEYRRSEHRIETLSILVKSRKIAYYFLTAFLKDDNADAVGEEEFSTELQIKRLKCFLKAEIKIEKNQLFRVEQKIVGRFKNIVKEE